MFTGRRRFGAAIAVPYTDEKRYIRFGILDRTHDIKRPGVPSKMDF
jgi:hypothetical protein